MPLIGQIEIFAFGNVPPGWAPCDGRLLPVNQNQALFSLLGIAYGGDGLRSFALPDLRGRVPIGTGAGTNTGQRAGEEAHALTAAELPAHGHALMADAGASPTVSTPSPATVLGRSSGARDAGRDVWRQSLWRRQSERRAAPCRAAARRRREAAREPHALARAQLLHLRRSARAVSDAQLSGRSGCAAAPDHAAFQAWIIACEQQVRCCTEEARRAEEGIEAQPGSRMLTVHHLGKSQSERIVWL